VAYVVCGLAGTEMDASQGKGIFTGRVAGFLIWAARQRRAYQAPTARTE
jgi:hypothetical protein